MAERRKGKHPLFSEPVCKLREFHRQSIDQQGHGVKDLTHSYESCLSFEVSKKPLKDLKPMQLNELRVLEYRKGKYLSLRTLEPVYEHRGLVTVVEDHVGNAMKFWAHHFPVYSNGSGSVDLHDVLPVGTTFLLKEPYCDETECGECVLHCGAPSDMIVVYPGHDLYSLTRGINWKNTVGVDYNFVNQRPLPTTATEWTSRGRLLWQDGKLECATRCYFMSLHILEQEEEGWRSTVLELAKVMMAREWYERAMGLCESVMSKDPSDIEAFKMAAQIACRLRMYKDARRYVDKCEQNPGYQQDRAGIDELSKRIETRIKERDAGEYDMYEIVKTQMESPLTANDRADHRGPISVLHRGAEGRSILASRDLAPGTLLAVSKALVFRFKPEEGEVPDAVVWRDLMNQLVILLMGSPEAFGGMVYRLFDGQNVPRDSRQKVFCDGNTKTEPIVDVRRLAGILKTNMFGDGCDFYQTKRCLKRSKPYRSGCGLFARASYFNHSCLPNAYLSEMNDLIFIRANQAIQKGDEIFVSYISWEIPYVVRRAYCLSRGFRCECELCQSESQLTEEFLGLRHQLFTDCETVYEEICAGNVDLRRVTRFILNIMLRFSNTCIYRSARDPCNIFDSALYTVMAMAKGSAVPGDNRHPNQVLQEECVKEYECSLSSLSFDMSDVLGSLQRSMGTMLSRQNALVDASVIPTVHAIASIHGQLGHVDSKRKWARILWELEKICSGGGEGVMMLKYPHLWDTVS